MFLSVSIYNQGTIRSDSLLSFAGEIVYYTLISIPVLFTIVGLVYMIRTNCVPAVREKCCNRCCVDLEKKDVNPDYGDYYYYADGERRQDVMEVTFDIIFFVNLF